MDSIYISWANTCKEITSDGIEDWKQHKDVHYMLEHVHGDYAKIYLELIINAGLTIADVQKYSLMVDAIGKANTHLMTYNTETFITSTTCLRYLSHAIEIFNYIKTFSGQLNIIEIGGGYGGLVVALNFICNYYNHNDRLKYTIIDLNFVQELQKYYTNHFDLNKIDLRFISSDNYGADFNAENIFVISNYCIGEIGQDNRDKYITNLLNKPEVIGGYFQWNSGASLDFLNRFECNIETEYPQTGPENKTVRFRVYNQ